MSGRGVVVAYALDRYHQVSQTFVDLEIRHLREQGASVHIVAMRRGAVDRSAEDPMLHYLDRLAGGPRARIGENARWIRHPVRYARFLGVVLRLRSEMGRRTKEHVRWWRLPGAAAQLESAGVRHIHSHFGWSGAAAAACLAALTGATWSMTLHARDIFSRRHNLEWKLRAADRVITVCRYNRDWLHAHVDESVEPAVLTCGVEPAVEIRSGSDRDLDVVTVARLVEKKGVDVLIRAMALLPRPAATLQIVGDGPQREELQRLAHELGVADIVEFAGEMCHDAALDRIARARVFALPCRIAADGDRDAMPTVIIEAMVRATPVVASAVVGIPEMVDEQVGRLVPPDDASALASALEELLSTPSLGHALGAEAVRRARERFAVTDHATRLLAEFETAMRR